MKVGLTPLKPAEFVVIRIGRNAGQAEVEMSVNQTRRRLAEDSGSARFDPIILERGITHDMDLEEWAAFGRPCAINQLGGTER